MTNGPPAVPKVELCPGGPSLSQFVYGTWRLMDASDPALTAPAAILARIRKCIDLGITSFDCVCHCCCCGILLRKCLWSTLGQADIYGGVTHVCERLFGQALSLDPSLRSKLQIVSKCGIVCPSTDGDRVVTTTKHYDLSTEYILKRVDESLEALGVASLDVLLIHRPSPMMNANEVCSTVSW